VRQVWGETRDCRVEFAAALPERARDEFGDAEDGPSGCYISSVHRHSVPHVALLLAVVVAVSALGCGYRLLRPAAEADFRVWVATFENDSVEPGVEVTMTRALRQAFLRRGATLLGSDRSRADVVIRGRVLPLQTRAYSFDSVSMALEYQVTMTLDLDVEDASGAPLRFDATALTLAESYLASADVEAGRKNRQEALRRIADLLAGRIHDAVGLQWPTRQPTGGES
jgi:hypothetical protein